MTQMIAISLPDGSVRQYASPVTGARNGRCTRHRTRIGKGSARLPN